MKCKDFERLMPEYWEGQLSELERYQIGQHVKHCSICMHDFVLWEESEKLIRNSSVEFQSKSLQFTITQDVMSRIYSENPWATPVSKRPFLWTDRFRNWITGISAALFIVFMVSIFFSSTMVDASQVYGEDIFSKNHHLVGIQPVGSATEFSDPQQEKNLFYGVVASIGEPASIPQIHTLAGKTYIIAFSLLGAVITVLGMSWIARVRT
jgi:hypothetical protein